MIKPAIFQETNNKHQVFQKDDNKLIKSITGDLLYLDPSYKLKQYGANYHLLNIITKYYIFAPKGVIGLSDYRKKSNSSIIYGTVEKSTFYKKPTKE